MNLLYTGAVKFEKNQLENLEAKGFNIFFHKNEDEKITQDISKIDYVICNNLFTFNDYKKFKSLKMIQFTCSGLDRVPIDLINDSKICCFAANEIYSVPISEWILLKILEVYKKSSFFYNNQKEKKWIKNRELKNIYGKKALILGYGTIGKLVAKKLSAFDVEVNVINRSTVAKDPYFKEQYSFEKANKKIMDSDIVILTLPLNEDTENLIDKRFLKLMKSSAILVNTSRGKIIVEKDLEVHLQQNKNFYAILDVFDKEPLSKNSNLWNFANVVLTPHNSFEAIENKAKILDLFIKNFISIGSKQ